MYGQFGFATLWVVEVSFSSLSFLHCSIVLRIKTLNFIIVMDFKKINEWKSQFLINEIEDNANEYI